MFGLLIAFGVMFFGLLAIGAAQRVGGGDGPPDVVLAVLAVGTVVCMGAAFWVRARRHRLAAEAEPTFPGP